MKVREITSVIERYAPLAAQEEWDNTGMQVGCLDDEVKGILLCTDVTPEIVDEAIAGGYNLIISHHPLIFHALKKIMGRTIVEDIVAQAIKHDINIYCAHTNMDNVYGGVSYRMASKLGMTAVETLDAKSAEASPAEQLGCGVIGNITPMPASDVLKMLKDAFEVEAVRYCGDTTRTISRIALCGGAGGFLVRKAINAGAQMYVSADLRYNDLIDNGRDIVLADIGHYESEHYTKEIFHELIMAQNPDVAVDYAKNDKNQIHFYI